MDRVSNPLLLTQFTPETVEPIELIRGPQGAAFNGTDAISGVINIVTRTNGSEWRAEQVARTAVGAASECLSWSSAITQDHAITVREGSASVGERDIHVPVGSAVSSRRVSPPNNSSTGFRLVRSKFIATGTERVSQASQRIRRVRSFVIR